MTHVDTHVLVWIYNRDRKRLPRTVIDRLEEDQIVVSPVVELELQLLFELGRVTEPAAGVLERLGPPLGLRISTATLASVAKAALPLTWTRDPFDRLIAANALADGAALVTADATIRAHLPQAVWET